MQVRSIAVRLAACFVAGFLTSPAHAQHAFDQSGLDAVRQGNGTRVELSVTAPDGGGARDATLEMTMNDIDGCLALFDAGGDGGADAFRRLCEVMDKSGRARIEMRGPMAETDTFGQSLSRLLAGTLTQVPDGAAIDLRVLVGEDGRITGLAASMAGGPPTAFKFDGGLNGDGETGDAPVAGTTYTLSRDGTQSTFTIAPVNDGGLLEARMTFEVDDRFAAIEGSSGWLHLSDAAAKDGDRLLLGRLERRADLGAGLFEGAMRASDTGARYDVTFRDLPGGTAAVGVRRSGDPALSAERAPWEIEYGMDALRPSREIDLLAHDWRVPQEERDDHGMSTEVSFSRGWLGYDGPMTMWFGEDATGNCVATRAFERLCERTSKDGPLALEFTLDDRRRPAAFGWSGTVRPVEGQGFNAGPWGLDVFQGSSIGDWGGEEPNALYMRIRSLEQQPGAEAVAWLKLVPLDRPARVIGPDGAIEGEVAQGTPPTPPVPSSRLGPDPDDFFRFPNSNPTPELAQQSCDGVELTYRLAREREDGSQFRRLDVLRDEPAPEVSREHWLETLDALIAEVRPPIARFVAADTQNALAYCTLVTRQINMWRAGKVDEFPYPFPDDPAGGSGGGTSEAGEGEPDNSSGSEGEAGTPVAFDPNDMPNGGTRCEALQSVYSQIGSADEQNRARALLEADPRMGSWRLPTTEQACATAAAIFSERGVSGF